VRDCYYDRKNKTGRGCTGESLRNNFFQNQFFLSAML
jgi:hypothetical protein